MLAAARGHATLVKLLVDDLGFSVNYADVEGITPLMTASLMGQTEIVSFIHNRGARVRARDHHLRTSLMWASMEGELATIELLVKLGSDMHAVANDGVSALIVAAFKDRPEVCLFFIGQGLDPALANQDGHSPISHYGLFLEEFHHHPDDPRPALTAVEKQARVKLLTDARAEYLELQWREERYQRRKDAMTFLQGCGFLLTAAQREAAKTEQILVDKHAKLAAIDRSTKEANLKFLHEQVWGHPGLQRKIAGMI
jgi:ankyrin repeat protein